MNRWLIRVGGFALIFAMHHWFIPWAKKDCRRMQDNIRTIKDESRLLRIEAEKTRQFRATILNVQATQDEAIHDSMRGRWN